MTGEQPLVPCTCDAPLLHASKLYEAKCIAECLNLLQLLLLALSHVFAWYNQISTVEAMHLLIWEPVNVEM